jgi:F0F1-type ATP synthase membrane subunit b/b'
LAVDVLEEVYNGRIKVLGEDAKDTQTTKVALEEANAALVVEMKELKANAERAIADAKWRKEKEEKEAQDKKAHEDALREQGKEEIRTEIAREKAIKREEHVDIGNRIKEAYWFGPK